MKKAGIVVDDWKLPIYRKALTSGGFAYTDGGGLTHDTTVLTVMTDDISKLQKVLENAERECIKLK